MTKELSEKETTVLKINIPFSSESIFVNVQDTSKSLQTVLQDVADQFDEDGRHGESLQLLNLLSDHIPHSKGVPIDLSTPVSRLKFDPRTVDNQLIQFAEISLLRPHTGGVEIKIELTDEKLFFPTKKHESDSCYDLKSTGNYEIQPGKSDIIDVGFKMEIPDGYEANIRPRSGLAVNNGITVLNSPGTIDSGFRGNVKVILINHGNNPFVIERGDRIAQMYIGKTIPVRIIEGFLESSARGENGFGSTGVK